jgi:hypothetical protein
MGGWSIEPIPTCTVRVQRLQDISEEDCVAEGVDLLKTNC